MNKRKHFIEIDLPLPDNYRPIRYSKAKRGEKILTDDKLVVIASTDHQFYSIIVEEYNPVEIRFKEKERRKEIFKGEYFIDINNEPALANVDYTSEEEKIILIRDCNITLR